MAIVTASRLSFHYAPGTDVIDSLSFSVNEGELLRLSGPNGSGKTTLIKLMARLYKPVSGRLGLPHPEDVGWMPDNPALLDYLTAAEHFRFLSAVGLPFDDTAALERAGLTDEPDLLCGAASFGVRRRISFAIAVALPRRLLLLDEPFNGIEAAYVTSMQREILSMLDAGVAIVIATHSPSALAMPNEKVLVLDQGPRGAGEA